MNLHWHLHRAPWKALRAPYTTAVSGVKAALETAHIPHETVSLSIVFGTNRHVQDLNARFRGKNRPTNILSFPAPTLPPGEEEDPGFLGDLILAGGVVNQEAKEQGKSLKDHTLHLIIHGVFHLLGYDHLEEEEAEHMEALEVKALLRLGIANPYLPI